MSMYINIRDTVEYKEQGYQIVTCPVCGHETLDSYYICPYCCWEYDGIIDEHTRSLTNGRLNIVEYREKYAVMLN